MILSEAKLIAINIFNKLKDNCVPGYCKIAGSIRREKPEPGDIELLALPTKITLMDMFGQPSGINRIPEWHADVKSLGEVIKGNSGGKMMQIALPEGIKLDLFMPDDFDFWRQYAIRTGSAEWTAKYIAGGWKSIGWCGSDAGLRLQSQCVGNKDNQGKVKWKCIIPESQQKKPPNWKSEKEFFDWIKLKWVEPKFRNVT